MKSFCVGSRCWTMTKAKRVSAGTLRKNKSSASRPPAEAPIPTIGQRVSTLSWPSDGSGVLILARCCLPFFLTTVNGAVSTTAENLSTVRKKTIATKNPLFYKLANLLSIIYDRLPQCKVGITNPEPIRGSNCRYTLQTGYAICQSSILILLAQGHSWKLRRKLHRQRKKEKYEDQRSAEKGSQGCRNV